MRSVPALNRLTFEKTCAWCGRKLVSGSVTGKDAELNRALRTLQRDARRSDHPHKCISYEKRKEVRGHLWRSGTLSGRGSNVILAHQEAHKLEYRVEPEDKPLELKGVHGGYRPELRIRKI